MTTTWRAWIVAVAIFVTGVAIGSTVTTWIGLRHFRPGVGTGTHNRQPQERALERIGNEIRDKLDLTPDEAKRVNQILREAGANLRTVRTQAARDAVSEMRATIRRISETLPAEKRDDFRRLVAKRFQRLGAPEKPGDGPDDSRRAQPEKESTR